MELKTIQTKDILANFYQPRTKFDRENIKELAESILSNGLINPITITPDKKRKGKYMIVSGERRWQAHNIAKIKTIPCVVKEYKTDGQFMVESLIENIHREDLSTSEKGKFCLKIKKQMKLKNNQQVANILKINYNQVDSWIDNYEVNKSSAQKIPWKLTSSTKGLPNEERKKIFDYTKKENKDSMFIEREFVPTYKKADEPTKKALLSGKVTVEEAKKENVPEPIQLERTANDVIDDILSNLHDFKYHVDELKKDNLKDISKIKAGKAMTTAGLHVKVFRDFVNIIRKTGAKPHPLILSLIKANGKV